MSTATFVSAGPLVPRSTGVLAGLSQSLTLAWRTIVRVRQNPTELGELAFQPIIFTLLFTFVFGAAISGDRATYLQFMIPGMMVMTMLSTTLQVGQGLNTDLEKGVFDRLRSLPIARWSPLAGRILADQVKQVWGIVLVLAVGLLLGFRPGNGFLGFVAAAALMMVFAAAFSWVAVLIGVTSPDAERVQMFGMVVVLPVSFVSGVFAPSESMPTVLRVFADLNPVGNLLEASRALTNGGAVAEPLMWTLAWCAALVIVFAPLSLRALNKRV